MTRRKPIESSKIAYLAQGDFTPYAYRDVVRYHWNFVWQDFEIFSDNIHEASSENQNTNNRNEQLQFLAQQAQELNLGYE